MNEKDSYPQTFLSAMRVTHARSASVPAAVDAKIMANAAKQFRARRIRRNLGIASGIAAAIVMSALFVPGLLTQAPARKNAVAIEDFNGDGKVDMRDAHMLALALTRNEPVPDVNGDAARDLNDADAIAAIAVRRDRGSL